MALVFLRNNNPTTPGTRWLKKLKLNKNNVKMPTQFRVARKWHAGRNTNGRVAFRSFMRRKYIKKITVETPRLTFHDIAVSANYHFTFEKNKPKVSFITKSGGSFILPATISNQPGRVYYSNDLYLPTHLRCFSGLPVTLSVIPYYTRVSNVAVHPYNKFQFATSSGSFCTKLRASKREKNIKLILPSKQYRFFAQNSLAIIGPNVQLWTYKLNFGKAGTTRLRGSKQRVRGIAMNSVDHPHGGKANSVQPEVSPWGWITKNSH